MGSQGVARLRWTDPVPGSVVLGQSAQGSAGRGWSAPVLGEQQCQAAWGSPMREGVVCVLRQVVMSERQLRPAPCGVPILLW